MWTVSQYHASNKKPTPGGAWCALQVHVGLGGAVRASAQGADNSEACLPRTLDMITPFS